MLCALPVLVGRVGSPQTTAGGLAQSQACYWDLDLLDSYCRQWGLSLLPTPLPVLLLLLPMQLLALGLLPSLVPLPVPLLLRP